MRNPKFYIIIGLIIQMSLPSVSKADESELSAEAQDFVKTLQSSEITHSLLKRESLDSKAPQHLILLGSPVKDLPVNIPSQIAFKSKKYNTWKNYLLTATGIGIGMGVYLKCSNLKAFEYIRFNPSNLSDTDLSDFENSLDSEMSPLFAKHWWLKYAMSKRKKILTNEIIASFHPHGLICATASVVSASIPLYFKTNQATNSKKEIEENVGLHSEMQEWILITDESDFLETQALLAEFDYNLE